MANLVISGDTSGSVTLAAPAVSGTTTLTLPTTTGTLVVNSGAQTIEFAAGTVSAPSITNSGDTNTGIFFPAADTIAFTEGGVEALRIDSSANVGIGTTSPGSRLEIAGSTGVAFTITQSGTTTGAADTGGVIVFRGSDGSNIRDSAYIYGNKENSTVGNYASYMSFWTRANGVAAAERMRINSSGNVGIGSTSITAIGTGIPTVELKGTSGSFTARSGGISLVTQDGTTNKSYIYADTDLYIQNTTATNTRFYTNNTERMRITSAGAVLIGTTSTATSSTLNIDSAGYQPLYVNTTISGGGGAAFSRSGTQALYTGTAGSSWLTGSSTADGLIRAESNLLFASNGNTERMRINSSGYLKVSNDGTYAAAAGSYHELRQTANAVGLYLYATNASYTGINLFLGTTRNTTNTSYYYLACYSDNAGLYRLLVADSGNVTNTNGSYGTISDAKLKENIVDATPKLDKVNQLKVRNFNLIGDELKQIGFVAQEFEQVFPSMVEKSPDKDKDGKDLGTTTKTIKTTVLIPILVKAIQEQQQIINDLKARIETLENK